MPFQNRLYVPNFVREQGATIGSCCDNVIVDLVVDAESWFCFRRCYEIASHGKLPYPDVQLTDVKYTSTPHVVVVCLTLKCGYY